MIRKENDLFEIIFRKNKKTLDNEIVIRSKRGGKYHAKYKEYFLVDECGDVISSSRISEDIANVLMDNILVRGDTEGFYLTADGKLPRSKSKSDELRIDEIVHKRSFKETNFTATGEKLSYHYPIFNKLKNTGYGSIIRATMTLHQLCSSHCQFCSTISRNKKDSISLEEAKIFVNKLYSQQMEFNRTQFPEYNKAYKNITGSDIGLRGLILSGGGQPNLWPHFVEFVRWIKSETDIELGLITNGFPRKVPDEIYDCFNWISISITPEDASPHYIGGKFDNQYIPKNIIQNDDITLGLSYVYGPWTTDDILLRMNGAVKKYNADYLRMLTDCNLTRSLQLSAHKDLSARLMNLGMIDDNGKPSGKVFHQLKYHGSKDEAVELWNEGQCYLQSYNVFWDTTGHEEYKKSSCYACDSITVLSDMDEENNIVPSERKFNSDKWGTVMNDKVEDLYMKKLHPFFDPRDVCASCLFMNNNRRVRDLIRFDYKNNSPDINNYIKHRNFP